jgi:integrase/recombinase XerD
MGVFRDRMQQNLQLAQYRPSTQESYLRCANNFVAFHMRPPTELGEEHIRQFLLTLVDRPSTQKTHLAAIKFLYCKTLNRPEEVVRIPWPRIRQQLPDIVSQREAFALLDAIESIKHRAILMAAYGAGLRITEACSLNVNDIDGERHLIHLRHGKGDRDRYVNLPKRLHLCLREYWKAVRPRGDCLFPGQRHGKPIDPCTVRQALKRAANSVGIQKRITPHSLRHAFATHLLEDGNNIRVIQALLGHRSIRTTARYTRVSKTLIGSVKSPLDKMPNRPAKKIRKA